jgi:predicted NBD/HSP70 family sugar kinase
MKSDKYMGVDIHQTMTVVAVLDADGKVILETMVATEGSAILRLVESLSAY